MAYLILMLVPLLLLAAFSAVILYEQKRGARLLAGQRATLDRKVEHVQFVVDHVDLTAFMRAEAHRLLIRIGHDIARLTLMAVRAIERSLTRLVRSLHMQRADDGIAAPRESTREFVRTLSDFKGYLNATRPEFPEIAEIHE